MKKLTFAILIISFGVFSCCKENENTIPDEYYVKYEVDAYSTSPISITINGDDNEDLIFTLSYLQDTSWEKIIGPVQEGFIASMEVSSEYVQDFFKPRIYVSKNNSPFALKESDESDEERDYVEISYTIDYE